MWKKSVETGSGAVRIFWSHTGCCYTFVCIDKLFCLALYPGRHWKYRENSALCAVPKSSSSHDLKITGRLMTLGTGRKTASQGGLNTSQIVCPAGVWIGKPKTQTAGLDETKELEATGRRTNARGVSLCTPHLLMFNMWPIILRGDLGRSPGLSKSKEQPCTEEC